jgi:hypothetical protein
LGEILFHLNGLVFNDTEDVLDVRVLDGHEPRSEHSGSQYLIGLWPDTLLFDWLGLY